MKNALYQYLATQGGKLSVEEIIIGFIASIFIGSVIFLSYRFSHAGTVYSAKFNVSLFMLTLVTTMVMTVIGNNVALSLGMVGALSIVRFRTAIKDPRDTAYIFWCIAAGICCGTEDYLVAGIGSAVIFFAMLFLGNVINNNRYLLVVRGHGENCAADVSDAVTKYFNRHVFFRVCNESKQFVELIYEVSDHSIRHYKRFHHGKEIQAVLFELPSVETVNLICQNDEITR